MKRFLPQIIWATLGGLYALWAWPDTTTANPSLFDIMAGPIGFAIGLLCLLAVPILFAVTRTAPALITLAFGVMVVALPLVSTDPTPAPPRKVVPPEVALKESQETIISPTDMMTIPEPHTFVKTATPAKPKEPKEHPSVWLYAFCLCLTLAGALYLGKKRAKKEVSLMRSILQHQQQAFEEHQSSTAIRSEERQRRNNRRAVSAFREREQRENLPTNVSQRDPLQYLDDTIPQDEEPTCEPDKSTPRPKEKKGHRKVILD